MTTTAKTARLCVFIIAIIALAGTAQAQKIPKSKPPKAEVKSQEAAVPAQPQTPEQVDAYMGTLTDAQARQALSHELRQQAAAKAKPGEDQWSIKGRRSSYADGGTGRLSRLATLTSETKSWNYILSEGFWRWMTCQKTKSALRFLPRKRCKNK